MSSDAKIDAGQNQNRFNNAIEEHKKEKEKERR
jgi:hypothetical protein